MEKGDRFIFYGKSDVTKGVVAKRYEKITYDITNRVKLIIGYIVSEDGKKYRENSCLKIKDDIQPTLLIRLISIIRKW